MTSNGARGVRNDDANPADDAGNRNLTADDDGNGRKDQPAFTLGPNAEAALPPPRVTGD